MPIDPDVIVHKIPGSLSGAVNQPIPSAITTPPKDYVLKRVRCTCLVNSSAWAEVGGIGGDAEETVNAGFEVILGRIDDLEETVNALNEARFSGDWYFVGYYAN